MNLQTSLPILRANLAPLIFLIASLTACGSSQAATNTLVPTSYTTTTGTSGGQAVATSIAIQDLSGTTDSWNKYVEFGPNGSQKYDGFQSFALPTSITPASVTGIQVKVNYRGPNSATQTWTWKIYNWATGSYTTVGTNSTAPSWGSWKVMQFNVSGTLANYVRNSDGRIQIGLSSNNTADAANIDYEAVIVTSGSGTGSSVSSVISSSKSSVSSSVVSSSSKSSSSSVVSSSSISSAVSSSSKSSIASSVASSSSSNPQVGGTYYVAPTGSDSNNGSLNSPWKTVQYAVNKAVAGDTVNVRAGTYPETINITRSGSAAVGQRIIFRNYPGERPVLD
ncbi:MAG: DUF1565 domain-containing protein, partial [Moraxellaceae bacterium]